MSGTGAAGPGGPSVSRPRRVDGPALMVAVVLLGLAGLVLRDGASLSQATAYGLGPEVMPYAVSGALVLLALGHLVTAFREGLPRPRVEADTGAILWLTGGLATLIAGIGLGAGFIPSTAAVFAATARAFGRRALVVDLLIGFTLGLVVYLLFSKLLTLSLPQGPVERLLP